MFGFGIWELVIVLVIVVVLFGASRLPALGKGAGLAITNFKRASGGAEKAVDEADGVPDKRLNNP